MSKLKCCNCIHNEGEVKIYINNKKPYCEACQTDMAQEVMEKFLEEKFALCESENKE